MKEITMDPRVKKMWIDAMLSGEYEQSPTRHREDKHTFSAFGVLIDVFLKEHGEEWESYCDPAYTDKRDPMHMVYYTDISLQRRVCEWAGVASASEQDAFVRQVSELSSWDESEWDFRLKHSWRQIAEIVDKSF